MFDDVRWLALEVKDLDRARSFYADRLGMTVLAPADGGRRDGEGPDRPGGDDRPDAGTDDGRPGASADDAPLARPDQSLLAAGREDGPVPAAGDADGPVLVLRRPTAHPRGGLHTHYALSVPADAYGDWYDRLAAADVGGGARALGEGRDGEDGSEGGGSRNGEDGRNGEAGRDGEGGRDDGDDPEGGNPDDAGARRSAPVEHRFGDVRSAYRYDPDGHCLELAGTGGPSGTGRDRSTAVTGVFEVTFEVADLDRAVALYRALGFEPVDRGPDRARLRGPTDLELWEPRLGLADARAGVHVDVGFGLAPDADPGAVRAAVEGTAGEFGASAGEAGPAGRPRVEGRPWGLRVFDFDGHAVGVVR